MKIIIIRHGEPDYAIDGLTEKGKVEAELLKDRLVKENIKQIYCSPLGRAKATIAPTLTALSMDFEICDWLREFNEEKLLFPFSEKPQGCWDVLPEYVNGFDTVYSPTKWTETDFIKKTKIPLYYNNVCEAFDALLKKHGYERDGYNYKVLKENRDTIVLVCHFGLASVLLSHIFNCSPYSLWQHTCLPPSSVTVLYSEERRRGMALFRANAIGDTSHLYANREEVSFAARFCECFTDTTRH